MSKPQDYPIAQPMQDKLVEKNDAVMRAQMELKEMIELARALAGAPPQAVIGDVTMGFVLPHPNGGGVDTDGDGRED